MVDLGSRATVPRRRNLRIVLQLFSHPTVVLISWSIPLGELLISIISRHIANYVSTIDTIVEPAPADSSPGVSSTSAATIISPSPTTTVQNASTSTGTLTNGPISCNYCPATFNYEGRGRKGCGASIGQLQRSARLKHIKHKHPETINYQPKIHKCRNCGRWVKRLRKHERMHCPAKETTLRNQEPRPVVSKDTPIQGQEDSTLEVGADARPQEA